MSPEKRSYDSLDSHLLKVELAIESLNSNIDLLMDNITEERKWRDQHISESSTSTHSRLNDKIIVLEKVCLNLTWKIFIVGLGGGALSGGIQKLLGLLK